MDVEGVKDKLSEVAGDTSAGDDDLCKYDAESNTRDRKMTEKGLEWQINVAKANARTAFSSWRACARNATILLSDTSDVNKLKEGRNKLESCLNNASVCLDKLCKLTDILSTDPEFISRFESIEIEHLSIMKTFSDQIRDQSMNDLKSQSSMRSNRSRCSSYDNVSKRSAAIAKAATLRAELKFIDMEAKSKAELQKIQTMKELEMAEAEMQALKLEATEDIETYSDIKPHVSVPSVSKQELVTSFLQSHSDIPAPVAVVCEVSDAYRSTNVPKSEVVLPPTCTSTSLSASPVSVSHPSSHSYVNAPTCTGVHLPLNPTAMVYTPSSSKPKVQATELPTATNGPVLDHIATSTESMNVDSRANSRLSVSDQHMLEITKTLAAQINLSRLPSPEPSVFTGNPLSYPSWKGSFEALIEQKQIPPAERIHYLKRYVAGPVRDVIDGFFLLSSEDAYLKAKELLDKRYGDPFVVANAFRDKLDGWPKIASRDGKGLQKFGDFLFQCRVAMLSLRSLAVLNDDRENQKLLKKLPDWMVTRWGRLVVKCKQENGTFPSFERFADFVCEEAKIACDPVTSLQSVHSVNDVSRDRLGKGPQGRSFLSDSSKKTVDDSLDSKSDGHAVDRKPNKVLSCPLCKGLHELETCKQYLDKSIADRKAFIKGKGLCFACLGENHISKRCRHRKKCQICDKYHPSSLHGDLEHVRRSLNGPTKQASLQTHDGAVFLNDTCAGSKCSMIVPVFVSHTDNPDKEKLVYALLDTQSDTTFILDDTCRALGVSGVAVQLSLSTMHAENKVVDSHRVNGLVVRGVNTDCTIPLPTAYSRNIMPANRAHIPTPETAKLWPHLETIADDLLPMNSCEIGLLIGYNCPRALVPREVIACTGDGPYGQRTDLGWGIVGIVDPTSCADDQIGMSHHLVCCEVPNSLACPPSTRDTSILFSLRTSVKEVIPGDVLQIMESDFSDAALSGPELSQEDKRFMSILADETTFQDGHYEMPLPFRGKEPLFPNNKSVALNRLNSLRKRLLHDGAFRKHYSEFMQGLLDKGHAEKVPDAECNLQNGQVWYIPHHGVYHPQKPNKIRVVFDCSSSFRGECLNSHLLQGPDMNNKLLGVLSRFRKEPIAFMCDVEKMFYQFRVSAKHRNYLRFLWWDSEDYTKPPEEFRMTVHLFGATSSPGCANFGFKRVADDHELEFGSVTANFIRRDFYVDDGLKSVESDSTAVQLIENSIEMCQKGGLRLHKFLCNSKKVLEQLNPNDCSDDLKGVDLAHDSLPVGRVLGTLWCVESDTFRFSLDLKDRPATRRGVLSTVSSVYDPFGFLAPFVLKGKQILQQLCADQSDWDDKLPEQLLSRWETWQADLSGLTSLHIPRCFKPDDFGEIDVAELHHFSDASSLGYGQCSYLRLVNKAGQVHCSLLIGKARVVPLKPISIPRLELSAAVLSVRMGMFFQNELEFSKLDQVYWTDSKIVLGYINNEARRFHIFVANRVQQIRNHTTPSQWRHVSSKENPADIASRGATAQELTSNDIWFNGPEFLWERNIPIEPSDVIELDQSDPEIKHVKCFANQSKIVCYPSLLDRIAYFSDWHRAKRAVALCLRYKDKLLRRVRGQIEYGPSAKYTGKQPCPAYPPVSVQELQDAEIEIIKQVQQSVFSAEIEVLTKHKVFDAALQRQDQSVRRKALKKESSLYKLDPFLDKRGLLHVGGRIQMSDLSDHVKFPVLLPRKGHITQLVIKYHHERVCHGGRGSTIGELRSSGIWIVGASSAVSYFVSKCVLCRRLRSQTQDQKMANLPFDRLEESPPFTNCAVDFFGPWYIKEGRRQLKRYGVLFTCLYCRAVHLETANSLDTSSFINSLRRFIAIRGPIRLLRSDRGTNFVGAERELREAVMELDEEQLRQFLLKEGCDLFEFKMNCPSSSHMGGVWERQIRSVRNVMSSLLLQHGSQLDDEGLRTFLCEASSIVNCRPLAVDNLNDPQSVAPLTPNHLITMKSRIILPPPGNFQRTDLYCRRRWRRIQYLANEFWFRWRVEYLQNLQSRNKWTGLRRNLSVGDIVLLKEDHVSRNLWRLGRVKEALPDSDGLVRKVKLDVASSDLAATGKRSAPLTSLERPIHKLVLIMETEEIPVEEPKL